MWITPGGCESCDRLRTPCGRGGVVAATDTDRIGHGLLPWRAGVSPFRALPQRVCQAASQATSASTLAASLTLGVPVHPVALLLQERGVRSLVHARLCSATHATSLTRHP